MATSPSAIPTGMATGMSNPFGGPPPTIDLLFGYKPSFIMAFMAAVFFSIALFIHSYKLFKYKTKYFNLLPQAALLGAVAASSRAAIIADNKLITAFLVLTLTGQALGSLTSIAVMFTFTRILWWITPNDKRTWSTAWAPVGAITFQWAGLAALCDITKMVGQSFLPPDPMTKLQAASGKNVQGAGNVLQMFVFGGFTIMAVRFHIMATHWEAQGNMVAQPARWKELSKATIAAAILMTVRQVYEVVALDQKQVMMSYAMTQEWVFWFFDQLPLLAIYYIYIVYHPGQYLPKEYTGFRLNRKKLLVIKNSGSDSASKNGYVISSPILARSIEAKSTWLEMGTSEVEAKSFGIAR